MVALERPKALGRGSTRRQIVEARRAAFHDVSASVRELVKRSGGAVTDEAWLSSSLRVTIPARALPEIEAASGVRAIDVPTGLVREGDAALPEFRSAATS